MDTIDNRIIELTELRIGNFLLYKGDLVCVTMISCDIDDEYQETIGFVKFGTSSKELANWNRSLVEDLKRIPITQEWIEMFAIKAERGLYKFEHTDFYLRFIDKVVDISIDSLDGLKKYYFKHNIRFVHQLQNLYFSLVGEELTIKQKA